MKPAACATKAVAGQAGGGHVDYFRKNSEPDEQLLIAPGFSCISYALASRDKSAQPRIYR